MDARDKLSVRLDPFTANQLTHICDDAGVKMSELVRGILARVVDIITDEAGKPLRQQPTPEPLRAAGG